MAKRSQSGDARRGGSSPKAGSSWRVRLRRWGKRLLAAVGAFLLLSALAVLLTRWIDPPFTPLMGLRKLEAKLAGEESPPIRYRWIDLEDVPRDFLRFVWVSEDGRFFRHHGFDFIELRAALREAWREKKAPRGASTITMQAARSTFLWQGRSLARKALEAEFTVWMELFLSKRRILEIYVNVIEMGDGVYGIEAAARHHFGKPSAELTSEQLAALAAILPSPRRWDPANPAGRAKSRRDLILKRSENIRLPASIRE